MIAIPSVVHTWSFCILSLITQDHLFEKKWRRTIQNISPWFLIFYDRNLLLLHLQFSRITKRPHQSYFRSIVRWTTSRCNHNNRHCICPVQEIPLQHYYTVSFYYYNKIFPPQHLYTVSLYSYNKIFPLQHYYTVSIYSYNKIFSIQH